MICQRCLRLSSQLSRRNIRTITASASNPAPNPSTSTSAAQPFSTPSQPSPSRASGIPKGVSDPHAGPSQSGHDKQAKEKAAPAIVSSVSAGTPLKGLNYFKGKEDPIAMEDHEYPPWLWTILSPKPSSTKGAGTIETDPRLYSKSAKARRMANKRLRASEAGSEQMEEQTPIYEQSVDLPAEDGARVGLNRAMREKRRKDIKTGNFLRGIR